MKANHLHDVWSAPDNTRLTSKQFSFRLPTHVAAKIAALCEMYPTKNRTQIVADLLTSALDDLEKNLPAGIGAKLDERDQLNYERIAHELSEEYEPVYCLGGPLGTFHSLANKHFCAFEQELGNESPEPLFVQRVVTVSEIKGKGDK